MIHHLRHSLLAFLLCTAFADAMLAQSSTWRYTQAQAGVVDDVNAIMLADGGMMLMGDGGLVRLDVDGNILWQKNGADAVFVDMVERADGSFVALSYDGDGIRAQITLFDANGNVLRHMKRLDDIAPPAKENLVLLPDGGFATLEGLVTDDLWGTGRKVHCFDADGDLQWARFIEGGNPFGGVMTMYQNNYYCAGASDLFRLAADGSLVWDQYLLDPAVSVTDIEVFGNTIAFAYKSVLPPAAFGIGVMYDTGFPLGFYDFPTTIPGFEVNPSNAMLDLEVSADGLFLLAEHEFLGGGLPSVLFTCDPTFGNAKAYSLDGFMAPIHISARQDGTFAFAAVDQFNLSATVCKGVELDGCYPMTNATITERSFDEPSGNDIGSIGSTSTWTDLPFVLSNAAMVRTQRCASVGIPEQVVPRISVFPNPVRDQLQVEWAGTGNTAWRIMDGTGRVVRTGTLHGAHTLIDLGGIASGPYALGIGPQVMGVSQILRFVVAE